MTNPPANIFGGPRHATPSAPVDIRRPMAVLVQPNAAAPDPLLAQFGVSDRANDAVNDGVNNQSGPASSAVNLPSPDPLLAEIRATIDELLHPAPVVEGQGIMPDERAVSEPTDDVSQAPNLDVISPTVSVTEIGLTPEITERKVTENEAQLANVEGEFARLLEEAHDASPTKTEAVNQAQKPPLGDREAVHEIEIVGNLLDAARMACGDLPSDAIGPLRTLLSITKMLCATAPGLESDIRDLIEAALMACGDLPPREGGALRTLLRVASGKLSKAKAGTEARNDAAAVVGLPRRPSGLDLESRRDASNARPPAV